MQGGRFGARPAREGGAVLIRLICAPAILAVIVGLLILHHRTGNAAGTHIVLAVMGAVGGLELALLLRIRERGVSPVQAAVMCALLSGVGLLAPENAALRMEWRAGLLAFGLIWMLFRHLTDVRPEALGQIGLGLLPMLYVGLLFSAMAEIAAGPEGAWRCLLVVLVAKASDIGGWLVGRPYGRHKMVPSVSPGKSWEGTAGGIGLSIVVALFVPGLLQLEPEASYGVLTRAGYGTVLAVASILAGVTQSGWKRRVGAKDSSTLIPEMGGVLDMIDSLLLAGPVALLWYRLALG